MGMPTRDPCLEICHAVNPQRFQENLTLYTTRKDLNFAEGFILTLL